MERKFRPIPKFKIEEKFTRSAGAGGRGAGGFDVEEEVEKMHVQSEIEKQLDMMERKRMAERGGTGVHAHIAHAHAHGSPSQFRRAGPVGSAGPATPTQGERARLDIGRPRRLITKPMRGKIKEVTTRIGDTEITKKIFIPIDSPTMRQRIDTKFKNLKKSQSTIIK